MARDPREVLGRLMALRALLWRTQFELHLGRAAPNRADLEARNADLMIWVNAATIPFSPRERGLIDRELGSWSQDEVAELVWRNEAAAILLWVLDQVPSLPPYTIAVPAGAIMERIERLPQLTTDAPPMRPGAEVARELEVASLWHWRSRTEGFKRAGAAAPPGDSYDATVARAVRSALDTKAVDAAAVKDGDLAIGTGRYVEVDESELRKLSCIAHERHWALTWVSDETTSWDTVHPST